MGGNRKTRVAAVGLAVSLAVVPAACGSSDDGVTATATTAKPAATTSTTAASTKPQTIKVTGSDYKFTGLPETAPAGSKISLTTDKSGEPHELVAVHVPESETRSAEEIGALSDADMETVLAGEPALVTIAMPGTTDTQVPSWATARSPSQAATSSCARSRRAPPPRTWQRPRVPSKERIRTTTLEWWTTSPSSSHLAAATRRHYERPASIGGRRWRRCGRRACRGRS